MVELSAGASLALGVIVGLLSTSIQSVGLTLQRKSHLLEEEKEDHFERRPPYKRRRWQLGMGMFIVANIVGSTIQITTLPLPVLSTLQASGLVFNSICASIILSEPFTRYSLVGTVLVAAGALLIGIFGAISEPSHNLDQLLALLGRRQFLLWMFGTALIVLALIIGNWFLKRLYPRPSPRLRLFRGMCFGCVSGILSAHSLLIAKSAVELLVRTIVDRHNQFNRWQSWIILLSLVAFALSQLYYMHRGLKLCSTSVLYPLVFCIYNIIAIIDGLIYFHQSSRLSTLHAGLIAVGTAILLGGVFSLSWRLDDGQEVREPQSPGVHIKHKGRVPTPQTVLTPGMGLVHSSLEDEEELPLDVESQIPGAHGAETEQQLKRKRPGVDESTPLLRHTTAPAPVLPKVKKRPSIQAQPSGSGQSTTTRQGLKSPRVPSPKASPSPRRPTPRRRRMTIAQETDEIWDELNDRSIGSLRSPARRSADLERRPRSGTLPPPRKNSDSKWLGQLRRRSWWEGLGVGGSSGGGSTSIGKKPVGRDFADEPDDGDEDIEDSGLLHPEGRRNSRPWGFGDRRRDENQERLGDWLKLKWWRKRWREEDGEGEGHDAHRQ